MTDGDDAFRLHGFIDRVDRAPDGRLRIIDYKTGGPAAFTVKAVVEGKKLQLPLYALAAERRWDSGPCRRLLLARAARRGKQVHPRRLRGRAGMPPSRPRWPTPGRLCAGRGPASSSPIRPTAAARTTARRSPSAGATGRAGEVQR